MDGLRGVLRYSARATMLPRYGYVPSAMAPAMTFSAAPWYPVRAPLARSALFARARRSHAAGLPAQRAIAAAAIGVNGAIAPDAGAAGEPWQRGSTS